MRLTPKTAQDETFFGQSASLIVVSDTPYVPLQEQTNLISQKLNKIGVCLTNLFFIEPSKLNEIHKLLVKEKVTPLLLTTTDNSNDHLLAEIVSGMDAETLSVQYPFKNPMELNVYDGRVFLLKNATFHSDLALTVQHLLMNSGKMSLFFDEASVLAGIKNKLANLDTASLVTVTEFSTNYSKFAVEIRVKKSDLVSKIRAELSDELQKYTDPLFMSNRVFPDEYLYDFKRFCDNTREDVAFLLTKVNLETFLGKLSESIRLVKEAFSKYDASQLCISFNGGKDCWVVFYLFYAVSIRLGVRCPLNALVFKIQNEFAEMRAFIDEKLATFFGLNVIDVIPIEKKPSIKENLQMLKTMRPRIEGIFMGTRRSDSEKYKIMSASMSTYRDWPKYEHINPILDWTYSEIWLFIRTLKLPYCSLYDRGYTSVGSTLNTIPNSDLLVEDTTDCYLSAYKLENEESERKSRTITNT